MDTKRIRVPAIYCLVDKDSAAGRHVMASQPRNVDSETFRMCAHYHDQEWGVPCHDDRRLFEFLILEGAQAGLAWATILRKRDAYRLAFADFDPAAVARYDEADVARLLTNSGLIRNRLKIRAAIEAARGVLALQEEFGSLDCYLWNFVDGTTIINRWRTLSDVPTETAISRALSRDLRSRGFRFVGPTIMYAFMQAMGMVDDHLVSCCGNSPRQLSPSGNPTTTD